MIEMKRILSYMSICATLVFASACAEDALDLFGDQNYIHFTQESSKAYRFSFATTPGEDTYELKIPVTLIGMALDAEKEYKVEVVTSGKEDDVVTTASSASYALPANPMFRKGEYSDTLRVQLKNNAELSQEKTLVIRIADNDNFIKGPVGYRDAVVYISNYLVQPDWWDEDMSDIFLGPYSDIKYQAFIVATGITDLKDMDNAHIIAYVSELVYYLRNLDAQGTPLYEADGITKVLDTVSYARNL